MFFSLIYVLSSSLALYCLFAFVAFYSSFPVFIIAEYLLSS
jgi:hypothetical protein